MQRATEARRRGRGGDGGDGDAAAAPAASAATLPGQAAGTARRTVVRVHHAAALTPRRQQRLPRVPFPSARRSRRDTAASSPPNKARFLTKDVPEQGGYGWRGGQGVVVSRLALYQSRVLGRRRHTQRPSTARSLIALARSPCARGGRDRIVPRSASAGAGAVPCGRNNAHGHTRSNHRTRATHTHATV